MSDADSTAFNKVTLTLANIADGADEQLVLDGSTYALNTNSAAANTSGGAYQVTITNGGLTVEITKAGGATLSETEVEALLNANLTYTNSSENPSTATDRTATIVVTDDGGQDSNSAVATIAVAAVNDAPEAADKTIGLPQDTSHVLNASDFGFTDVDGDTLALSLIHI